MELIITALSGETKTVNVNPSATIGQLKQKIAPLFEARPSQLKLSVNNGQPLQLDIDQKTVRDYGLNSGSTVMLLISMTPVPFQVIVKNEKGQAKMYDITEDETTDGLMTMVSQKEGVPLDQLRLIHEGKQLQTGRKLQDYKVAPGNTFQMTLRLRGGCWDEDI